MPGLSQMAARGLGGRNHVMNKRISFMWVVMAAAMALPGLAFAQYDFDAIAAGLPAKLNEVTVNAWSTTVPPNPTPVWQFVKPNPLFPAPWEQLADTFDQHDHTGDGIKDVDHLALLARILNDDPCCRALLGDAKMNAIQAAFAANKARVQEFEMTLCLEIFNTTRINLRIDTGIIGCISISNRPVRMNNTYITTGSTANLCLTVDTGIFILGNYTQCFDADIPSLWGPGGVLDGGSDGLDDDLANLLAAYLTIGDQNNVDYMQALIAQVVARGVLPNIATIILGAIGGKADDLGLAIGGVMLTAEEKKDDEKAYELYPPLNDIYIDIVFNPYYYIQLGNGCGGPLYEYVEIRELHARILASCATDGIHNWVWNYRVNDNGFTSYFNWLAAAGNLNEAGLMNALSYSTYGGDRTSFFISEWAAYPALGFNPQPTGGTVIYGAPDWNFNAGLEMTPSGISGVTNPTDYQWQWNNGGVWTNIPGANTIDWQLPLDYLGEREYRVLVTAPAAACGSATSNTATVKVDPPPIVITLQPIGGTVIYGDDFTLSVNATIDVGGLKYQWELNGFEIPFATSPSYQISNADFSDEGFYRCVITSDTFPDHFEISDTVEVDVVPPPITVTVQPVGATIPEGGSHLLETDATIAIGGLTYQWQLNGVNIPLATGQTYDIVNAVPEDQGNYRCRIDSDAFPGHFTYTNTVFVRVGEGGVVYVDKFSPAAPGTEDGLDWETAFKTIQEGIDAAFAAGGGQVWVAGGPEPGGYVYDEVRSEPWGDPPVTGSLVLKEGVEVYGGFEGWHGRRETVRSQRGVRRAVTIIDGSVSRAGAPAYHVVVIGNATEPVGGARLDGFDVRGGHAVGIASPYGYHTYRGAGLFSWLSSPTIENCTFYANIAEVSGGAIAVEGNDLLGIIPAPQINNCVFFGNHAERIADGASGGPNPVRGGGAIFNNYADALIQYCTIANNTLGTPSYTEWGAHSGGIYNWSCSPVVNSTIVWDNTDGGIQSQFGLGGSGEAVVSYSDVQVPPIIGPGPGNISSPPAFSPPVGPEFDLTNSSPCRDTGDPASPAPSRDLPGAPRPQELGVDMGAYEYVPTLPVAVCQDAAVTLDENGEVIVSPQLIRDPATSAAGGIWRLKIDNGGTPDYSLLLDCSHVPDTQVTLTVIDYHGQTDTCTATITVTDDEFPDAVCQNITVYLDDAGNASIAPQDVDDGSSDNCGIDWGSSTVVPNTFDCSDIGSPVVVTLTVSDPSGNTDTCLALVTVADQVAPDVACQNIILDLDEFGNGSITPADIDNGTTDNCDPDPLLELDITEFTCADLGANSVVLTATDTYANSDSCSATVTVRDVTPAVIVLNGDAYVQVPYLGTYTELGAVAQDACDGAQPAIVGGDTVDTSTLGFYTVTYDYTDSSGNVSTQEQRTVRVVSVPVITIVGDNPATVECNTVYNDDGATAWDAIDGDLTGSIETLGLPIPTQYTGTYQVTYRVTNSFGITTEEIRTVDVVDSIAPTFTILGPTTYYVVQGDTWTAPNINAFDDCDGIGIVFNLELGGDYPPDTNTIGTYVVSYDLSDNYGNPAPTQYVTVYVIEALLHFVADPQDEEAYVDDGPFDLSATVAGGFNLQTYQWYRVEGSVTTPLGVNTMPLSNTVSITVDPAALGTGLYEYYVRVTDEVGTEQSGSADVTIADHMSISGDIADDEVVIGSNYSMSIGVSGGLGALSYQWFKDDGAKTMQPLSDGGNISGANADTLNFTPFTAGDAGDYQVSISDNYETIYSSVATLTAATGVPAAGVFGLAILAALSAAGGAVTLRRRNRR